MTIIGHSGNMTRLLTVVNNYKKGRLLVNAANKYIYIRPLREFDLKKQYSGHRKSRTGNIPCGFSDP